MILLEFSIYPLDKGVSLSPYVARCLDVIDRSGVAYQCHAMGTILEGEYDDVMDVVRQCFNVLAADCDRISCSLKFDYRRGVKHPMQSKIEHLEERLGRAVRK